jgi:hypothetical protein
MGKESSSKLDGSVFIMFLACAIAFVSLLGAANEVSKPARGDVMTEALWFGLAIFLALLAIYMKIPSGHDRPVSGVNGGATGQALQVASEGPGKVSGRKRGEGRSDGQ